MEVDEFIMVVGCKSSGWYGVNLPIVEAKLFQALAQFLTRTVHSEGRMTRSASYMQQRRRYRIFGLRSVQSDTRDTLMRAQRFDVGLSRGRQRRVCHRAYCAPCLLLSACSPCDKTKRGMSSDSLSACCEADRCSSSQHGGREELKVRGRRHTWASSPHLHCLPRFFAFDSRFGNVFSEHCSTLCLADRLPLLSGGRLHQKQTVVTTYSMGRLELDASPQTRGCLRSIVHPSQSSSLAEDVSWM